MPIHRLLQNHAFGPDAIAVMVAAFEDALHGLSVSGIDFLSEDFQDA